MRRSNPESFLGKGSGLLRSARNDAPGKSEDKQQFAIPSRIAPGVCFSSAPSEPEGCREGRAPAGTRKTPVHECVDRRSQGRHRYSRMPGLPCAVVETAYVALSPVSRSLLPPSPCGFQSDAPVRLDKRTAARLDAGNSGVTTTRFCRTRPAPPFRARLGFQRRRTAPADRSRGLPALRPLLAPTPPASTAPHPPNPDDRDPSLPTG